MSSTSSDTANSTDHSPVRSEEQSLDIELRTLSKTETRTQHEEQSASSDRVVPLTPAFYRFVKQGDSYQIVDHIRIRNIPTSATGFIDLANAGDFAANVFNEIPVPSYAIVLMAVGATVAGIMAIVALKDGRRSWKNIQHLRQERRDLNAIMGDPAKARQSALARLNLNDRDLGTEIFDRAGMELALGFAALLVCVGTYMAIDGANRKMWYASNLLSGYIGNAPAAFYGIINSAWSWHIWIRVIKQWHAANLALDEGPVRLAVLKRIKTVRKHAVLTGVVCLVSGAMGMLTPTRWWPYPVLLVCGLTFVYGTFVYKFKIGYERPLILHTTSMDADTLITKLAFLIPFRKALKTASPFEALEKCDVDYTTVEQLVHLLLRCDLFEDFCLRLLNNPQFSHVPPLQVDGEVRLSPQIIHDIEAGLFPAFIDMAQDSLTQAGPTHTKYRKRFLLEALGSCLLASQQTQERQTP